MVGFGYVGGGNSSSSFSNLSPLAPPFTVDRLNPKPNANPHVQSPFNSEPSPHNWGYSRPSAPDSEFVDSTRMTSMPLSDDYQFSVPMSVSNWSAVSPGGMASGNGFGYGDPTKSYYSSYYDGDSLSTSGYTVSSQKDHIQSLSGLTYGPARIDSLGYGEEKWTRRVELDEGYSYEKESAGGWLSYDNQLSKGGNSIEVTRISKHDNDASNDKFKRISKSIHVESVKDKLCISAFNSNYPDRNTSSDNQKLYITHGKCIAPDSPSTRLVSVTRPSPKVIIRPPPAVNGSSSQSIVSPKPSRSDNVAWAQSGDLGYFSNSTQKDIGQKLSSEIKQGNGQVFVSASSLKELSTPYEDSFDESIATRFGSQLPNIKVSGGFNRVQLEGFSDLMDDQYSIVDSPCWKKPASLEVSSLHVQTGSPNTADRDFNVSVGTFNHEKLQDLYSGIGLIGTSSEMALEGNKITEKERETNDLLLGLEKNLDCSSRPASLTIADPYNGSEGGAVAVHAAEKVLDSPLSQEEATEHTEQCLVQKIDVPTVIKTMHNLSKLLLSHLSNDACVLEKEYSKTLNQIRANLDSCVSKKTIQGTNAVELSDSASDTSKKYWESHLGSKISGAPHSIDEDEEPVGDDLDVTKDDSVTKAIRNVLEENFEFDEEMQSQDFLFKNLWLEAEAKLCSIVYKARFDRMKLLMENSKPDATKGNEDVAEMVSKVHITPEPNTAFKPIPSPINHSIPILPKQKSVGADVTESSVLDRFNIILKRNEDVPKMLSKSHILPEPRLSSCPIMKPTNHILPELPKQSTTDATESSVMDRFKVILKRREQQADVIDAKFAEKKSLPNFPNNQFDESMLKMAMEPRFQVFTSTSCPSKEQADLCRRDFPKLDVLDDPMGYSLANINDQHYSGSVYGSNSGWEHVDNPWKNS